MDDHNREISAGVSPSDPYRSLRWGGLAFAIAFPTLITWGYFVLAGRYSTGTQQTVYLIVKVIQFTFPAAWTWLALREPLRTSRPTASGMLLGIAFSVVVVSAGMALFEFALRDTSVFTAAAELIHRKIEAFGIDSAWKYFLMAGFYSLFHSLFEEYYWRWFVFRQLRRLMPLWPAVIISGVAFTLHHIVVLGVFFQGAPLLIAVLAAAIAIGGFFWAWLYQRSNSIFDTWLSHLLIDAGLFFGVGYELVRHTLAQ
jgi:membrane protease YdiL (CAAX protease family)